METTGKITGISRDYTTNKLVLTMLIDTLPSDLDDIRGCDALDITARRHRQKRSLNANAYFHLICGKIAAKLGESITERKNALIAEYGQVDTAVKTIILADEIDWKTIEPLHLRPTTATRVLDDGRLYRVYYVMRGSHTYDTAEMSRLIDATVDQAKELGIETLTPIELERMKAAWTGRS